MKDKILAYLKRKSGSIKGFGIHIVLLIILGVFGLRFFFYSYLPKITNHGDSITVPDLRGIHVSELGEYLSEHNLRYKIIDSFSYDPSLKPRVVLDQHPFAGSKVKEERKIYVGINSSSPPLVTMPKLKDVVYREAAIQLKSYGLRVGKVEYRPYYGENTVIEQLYRGREIKPGTKIQKGEAIDLVVSLGQGNHGMLVPDLYGIEYSDFEETIRNLGFIRGDVKFIPLEECDDGIPAGIIINQKPIVKDTITGEPTYIKTGSFIDIEVSGPPID